MEFKLALLDSEKELIKEFLNKFSLSYDQDIDYSLYVVIDEKIIGTISASLNIIKAFAVDLDYRGSLASTLISRAINELYRRGYTFYQVYTTPNNKAMFEAMNFYEIISSENVSLLESKNRDIMAELIRLKDKYKVNSSDVAAIVMNCNPFTNGHLYLITEASKKHEQVIVFLLEEEKSMFSFASRYEMVLKGVASLDNVVVIPSSNYLISSLTFPTYFLKQEDEKTFEEAKLDALIFEKYFIPIFNIKKRYLGSEEDIVTSKYNKVLKEYFGDFIEIIPRIKNNDKYISASIVRKYLENKEFEKIKEIVPLTTYSFLKSKYE